MSLAEPRRRRKNPMHSVNLSAPNHWTNDDSKFGQRMLEKFGWTKGTGLGKNNQGIKDNIRVQHKVTPTGLGFVANNADDWFKAGEDYSRLLSQLTEKFDQYQTLSKANDDTTSKKSLVQNSLNSKSRVHYHKFTKGKDLTQYKKEELTCILGKGVKNEDQNLNGLDMKEYFKTKRESKKVQIDTLSNGEPTMVIIDGKIDQNNTIVDDETVTEESYEHEICNIPLKKKKHESKLSKEKEISPVNGCDEDNNTKLKKKEKKSKVLIVEEDIDDADKSKKKKKKLKIPSSEDVNGVENHTCADSSDEQIVKEPDTELILTHKFQNLIDLMIENSSAGQKYCKEPPNSLFEKKMKEFTDRVKHQYATKVVSTETKPLNKEQPITLDPDNKNFIKEFETQKSKALEGLLKRQEVAKYVNEKSMFIAQHGDVLFFGSNINDIKGYGD